MPPKKCASCTKSVYPVEEFKCLDKVWHKGCFKCQVCNMTLNMKNYKGYDKLPYCNAHYPETKFTAVADTPEARRLAQNSKIQSNIKYHEEYEKEKGQYTAVADDPETLRVRKNMETISNVAYHGELARRQEMENTRPNEYEPNDAPPRSYQAPPTSYQPPPTSYTAPPPQQQRQPPPPQNYQSQQPMAPPSQQGYGRRPGSIQDYDPTVGHANSPYSNKTQSTTVYNSQAYGGQRPTSSGDSQYNQRSSQGQPGSHSYGGGGSAYQQQSSLSYGHNQPAQQSYQSQARVPMGQPHQQPMGQPHQQPMGQTHQQGYRPPYNPAMAPPQQQQPMRQPPQQQQLQRVLPPPQQQRAPQPPRDPYYGKGKVSRAIYDYSAADDDEVGFMEGDLIINCDPIDDGWMMGIVEHSGQRGMLPSNYVDNLNW